MVEKSTVGLFYYGKEEKKERQRAAKTQNDNL